ncbi:hypothetical protein C367_06805 [Cryptococcus neoformans Ze90-1]|nr:hypothetical protein C367_06805 [Cryptococcus neoformans var. grubii Ze90-1]
MAHDSSCFSLWAMRLYEFTLLNPKGDGFLLWIFWSSSSLNLLVQAFPSLGPILTPLSPVSCESYFVPDKYHVCAFTPTTFGPVTTLCRSDTRNLHLSPSIERRAFTLTGVTSLTGPHSS